MLRRRSEAVLGVGRPVGRVLSCLRRGDHPSATTVAGRLVRSTRMLGRAALERILSDLAPGGVCLAAPVARRTGGLLHHRFTLTALRRGRRSVLCGTDPAGCPGWLLATTLPCGARTFLDPPSPDEPGVTDRGRPADPLGPESRGA
jgi:hypothetical protein